MPVNKHEVKVYHVEYICDKCKIGEMRPKQIVLTSCPPKYPHYCSHCGHNLDLEKAYLCVEYEFKK